MRANPRHVAWLAVLLAGALWVSSACALPPDLGKPLEPTLPMRRSPEPDEPLLPPPAEPDRPPDPELAQGPPEAMPRIGDDELRQLDLRGVPLSEAIHLIAAEAGVNVYLDARLDRRVDASFPAVRLDDALGVLLARNDLRLVEEPSGIFWVTRADGSELESGRFQLRSINGAEVAQNLKELVPADATVVVDPNQNFVVVRGRKRDVDAVAEYLRQADRLKPQVLIEVEILEVVLDDRFELGVQHLLQDPNFLGETTLSAAQNLGTPGDAFTGTISLQDFSLTSTINALEEFGAVTILSSPRVLAVTNTPARIDVVTEVPYVETTTSITSEAGDLGTTSQESVAFKEAGIKLLVTPVVQEEDIVQLTVDQEFSEVVDFFLGIPVLDSRKLVTQFLVHADQAVVLGGLRQNRKSEVDRGVPILMHVPLVGRLFRSDEDLLERRELLVLMHARVLDPAEAAAMADAVEKDFHARLRSAGIVEPEGL